VLVIDVVIGRRVTSPLN